VADLVELVDEGLYHVSILWGHGGPVLSKFSGRMGARWIQPDRWNAQMLTGHGDFRARPASLGLVDVAVVAVITACSISFSNIQDSRRRESLCVTR
jgi:hypothetical protein